VLAGTIVLVELDQRRSGASGRLRSENETPWKMPCWERSATLADANRELTWFSKRSCRSRNRSARSLALELHDQIGQELASLVLSLSRCEREMAGARQQEARSAVQDSIEIARAAYWRRPQHGADLRPAMLDRPGLIPTLQVVCAPAGEAFGLRDRGGADAFPVDLPSDV